MTFRECERIYKCGKGTEELCRKSLCPFYKLRSDPKPKEKRKTKKRSKVKSGYWDWSDPSGIPQYREE